MIVVKHKLPLQQGSPLVENVVYKILDAPGNGLIGVNVQTYKIPETPREVDDNGHVLSEAVPAKVYKQLTYVYGQFHETKVDRPKVGKDGKPVVRRGAAVMETVIEQRPITEHVTDQEEIAAIERAFDREATDFLTRK